MKTKIYEKLPDHIKGFLLLTGGWLVGNSIQNIIDGETPKDYDIIITNRHAFQNACKNWEVCDLKLNSFGGMKIQLEDTEIDFWCEELSHFLITANKVTYIFNMRKNILLQNV